jgi:hypothetical protein
MIINVTDFHIRHGRAGHCEKCPIALALVDLGCRNVIVDGDEVFFTYEGQYYHCNLPEEAAEFIEWFDSEETAHSFSFELDFT